MLKGFGSGAIDTKGIGHSIDSNSKEVEWILATPIQRGPILFRIESSFILDLWGRYEYPTGLGADCCVVLCQGSNTHQFLGHRPLSNSIAWSK